MTIKLDEAQLAHIRLAGNIVYENIDSCLSITCFCVADLTQDHHLVSLIGAHANMFPNVTKNELNLKQIIDEMVLYIHENRCRVKALYLIGATAEWTKLFNKPDSLAWMDGPNYSKWLTYSSVNGKTIVLKSVEDIGKVVNAEHVEAINGSDLVPSSQEYKRSLYVDFDLTSRKLRILNHANRDTKYKEIDLLDHTVPSYI